MVAWPVVAVSILGVLGSGYVVYRYGWKEPEAMQPVGLAGAGLRRAGLYDSTLARRILVGLLGGSLVLLGALIAYLGWLIE